MLVEWNSQECEKSTPQNDYDLLIKFAVDRAAFFILSTPPPFVPAASSAFVRSPALSAQGASFAFPFNLTTFLSICLSF